MTRRLCFALSLALLMSVGAVPFAAAQQSAASESSESVVVRSGERSGVRDAGMGDVGAELLPGGAWQAPKRASSVVMRRAQQRQDEVTTDEFTRGALVGGAAGAAAGALIGAVLGGGDNPRWETALPVAMVGLAAGAPTGVYAYTGQQSRYLWGAAGVGGAVAAGTALYLAESR